MTTPRDRNLDDFTFVVMEAADITDEERRVIHALFAVAYRDANAAYLVKSLSRLKHVGIAMHGDTPPW